MTFFNNSGKHLAVRLKFFGKFLNIKKDDGSGMRFYSEFNSIGGDVSSSSSYDPSFVSSYNGEGGDSGECGDCGDGGDGGDVGYIGYGDGEGDDGGDDVMMVVEHSWLRI